MASFVLRLKIGVNVGGVVKSVALSSEQINELSTTLPDWRIENGMLARDIAAPDFLTAIDWVGQIGRVSEDLNHHPDIDIRWRNLRIAIVTHDLGNALSNLDVALAQKINAIAK